VYPGAAWWAPIRTRSAWNQPKTFGALKWAFKVSELANQNILAFTLDAELPNTFFRIPSALETDSFHGMEKTPIGELVPKFADFKNGLTI
jgi:hypothetical protein